jgi:hypothetical protein
MTLPTQRGPDTGAGGGGVLGFVAESLRRLEDSVMRGFADVNRQLTEMPTHYVPRREVERRFDELCIDLGAEQAARKADIADLKSAAAAAEQSRVAARRWVIGLAVATSMSGIGVISGVVLHFT